MKEIIEAIGWVIVTPVGLGVLGLIVYTQHRENMARYKLLEDFGERLLGEDE